MTEELLQFSVYTSMIYRQPADRRWCVAPIYGERVTSHQCNRKPKHEYGGHGWCAQHYPPNVEKRDAERRARWAAESAARKEEWDAKDAAHALRERCLRAIKEIAAGHNDPRGLAIEVLKEPEQVG